VESVREDLEDLHRRFSASPALLRVAGRPVFYLYDSYRCVGMRLSVCIHVCVCVCVCVHARAYLYASL
jgi:hypothetical protein